MANKQHSSSMILTITVVVAIVLMIIIWPLSMLGKGPSATGSGDEVELRILPVARIEMKKAVVVSDGKPRDGATTRPARLAMPAELQEHRKRVTRQPGRRALRRVQRPCSRTRPMAKARCRHEAEPLILAMRS